MQQLHHEPSLEVARGQDSPRQAVRTANKRRRLRDSWPSFLPTLRSLLRETWTIDGYAASCKTSGRLVLPVARCRRNGNRYPGRAVCSGRLTEWWLIEAIVIRPYGPHCPDSILHEKTAEQGRVMPFLRHHRVSSPPLCRCGLTVLEAS